MIEAGERLGPFLMLECIGRGGMGEVWLAQPVAIPGVHELCVVKTVRAEQADDADALRRFADESRLAMLLHHPHISRVVDAGRAGEVRYLALDLVEGVDTLTLMRRLAERKRFLDEGVALWIIACALDALAFAHAAKHPLTGAPLGVVHRDISPHNLMCARTGNAHVIDFGLALSSVKQARTEQDVVLGKLAYMSPEQARAEPVDARCDIYAIGVVLYELITGMRYWGGLTQHDIWKAAGTLEWTPPGFASVPRDIAAVLEPMIARDPAMRSSDATERLEALMPLLLARGGPMAASALLAQIVEDNATDELDRVARARAKMASLPDDAPTETFVHPETQSFAIADADAVAAALATIAAPTTIAMPAFTMPPPRVVMKQATPSLLLPSVPEAGEELAPTVEASRPAAPPKRLAAAAVVGALACLAVVVVVALGRIDRTPRAARDAGPAPIAAAPAFAADAGLHVGAHADAGSDAGAAVVDAHDAGPLVLDAGTREARVDAGPPPRRRTLDERLQGLARCDDGCARGLRDGRAKNGPLEKLRGEPRTSIEGFMRTCEVTCRKHR